jgi:hypothetical protein
MGYGSGENTSLSSRFDILFDVGIDQIAYAPVFGNINVAYLTSGNAGRTLHNFLPNIMAELGLIGLLIVLLLLFYTFRLLLQQIRIKTGSMEGFKQVIISIWLYFTLIFLFVYANFTVGKSWPVMWFVVGFVSISFRRK